MATSRAPSAAPLRIAQAQLFPGFRGSNPGTLPDTSASGLGRRGVLRLDPFLGAGHGLAYDLALSPEGLDTVWARIARDLTRQAPDDAARLRLLSTWGFDFVVIDRPFDKTVAGTGLVGPALARDDALGTEVHLVPLARSAPSAMFVSRAVAVTDVGALARHLSNPAFDPRQVALLATPLADTQASPDGAELSAASDLREVRKVRVVEWSAERIEVEVEVPTAGAVVLQRAYLPLYRATIQPFGHRSEAPSETGGVDQIGEVEVKVEAANLFRVAIRVPAGRHRVVLEADRSPLRKSLLTSLAGLVGLLGLALLPARSGGQ